VGALQHRRHPDPQRSETLNVPGKSTESLALWLAAQPRGVSMNVFIAVTLGIAFLFAMLASDRFRSVANELWGHYVVNLLKYGWPYVLIFALYDLISNGLLANSIKTILSSVR
jgi:hypothetical protein